MEIIEKYKHYLIINVLLIQLYLILILQYYFLEVKMEI